MGRRFVNRTALEEVLGRIQAVPGCRGTVDLIGRTSLLFEGWCDLAERVELRTDVGPDLRPAVDGALAEAAARLGIDVEDEHPGDVIPLPEGHASRAREARGGALRLRHFDPYSVAFLSIARGDEPDYHVVLEFLAHGWIEVAETERLLAEVLPRFSLETIQQDPAEFRRRYDGLMQMWRAVRPGTVHRSTPT